LFIEDDLLPELMVGAAQVEITPPVGAPLSGYNARNGASTGIHDDLFAKALVVGCGEERIAVISLDVVFVDLGFTDRVREGIREMLGIPPHHTLVAATHTHSGPSGFFWPACPLDTPGDPSYVDVLVRKAVGATYLAARGMVKGQVGAGTGIVTEVGKNRDDLDGPMDPRLGVLYFSDAEGKPLAVLLNYACHPTVLGPDNLAISADFPGYACLVLERVLGPGVVALYTSGALGDVGTRLVRRSRTFDEAQRLGTILGAEALKAIQKIEVMSSAVHLRGARRRFTAPPRRFPSLPEAQETLEEAERLYEAEARKGSPPGLVRAAQAWVEGAAEMVRVLKQWTPEEVATEVQVLAIGTNLLAGLPGEPFVEIGLRMKERLGPGNVMVLGCANDYVGYILTRQDCEKKVYEAACNLFAPNLETIVENAVEETAAGLTK
jgi:neutral ceramidase